MSYYSRMLIETVSFRHGWFDIKFGKVAKQNSIGIKFENVRGRHAAI